MTQQSSPSSAPTPALPSLWKSLPSGARKGALACAALYGAVLMVGMLAVALGDPNPSSPALAAAQAPTTGRDLATVRHGARVQVSSYHPRGQHHAIFAIDGLSKPSDRLEKWTSAPDDPNPWIEVQLAGTADVERIELALAGVKEHVRYTMDRYSVVCFSEAGDEVHRAQFKDNTAAVAKHALPCPGTQRVRVTFGTTPKGTPKAVARLYEVVLIGKPQSAEARP